MVNDVVISGLFTLLGVVVGGIVSYFISKDEKEINALHRRIGELQENNSLLRKDVIKLCGQVASYWNLEKIYSEEVARLTNKKPSNVLKKQRDIIEANGYERPSMTEKGTRDILEKL